MIFNKKIFPNDIRARICESVKTRKVNITFYDCADVIANNTNIRFIEPYKILFTSKNKSPKRYLVALIFNSSDKQTLFINEIGEHNQCS